MFILICWHHIPMKHVLLEYEFDFQKHRVMFNMAQGYRGEGYDNIHIINVRRVEDE